ncbi:LMBR1-like membrane protein-domain-containing protein [Zychaea mexicana]|uniref:LMBR1-like membrane protein-domain-containing protein n=1 Tax=Zychaea mexicana TaxID=64656 RepID=UPI0022FE831A|nr:LMBR1-like membrane protein-domain-containing protein [Zychaea mexicana]KAI9496861.1 LMBR1-like membrane protein-domain-containing protein [Zychaea mexicana]
MDDDPPPTDTSPLPSPSPSLPPIDDNNDPANNYAPLILGTIALFMIAVATVSRYGNVKEQPWYVSVVCIIGWCFPFWIVLLLPLDIASTMYDNCEGECQTPFAHVSQSFLYVAWRTLYWTSFCLTWVMIPMMQAYVNTGDFGFTQRVKAAVQVNLRFYSIYVVVGFFGLLYLIFGSGYTTKEKIQGFVMAMANSWGLFLVIVFLGYGLVAVPRRLWITGNTKRHLRQLYANASKGKEESMDSELEFIELAKTMHAIAQRITPSDPFVRNRVDQMIRRFPFVLDNDYSDRENSIRLPRTITEEYLVKLCKDMIIASRMRDRKLALWRNLLHEAFYLQDVISNRSNTDHRFHSTLRPLSENTKWNDFKACLEWWWVLRLEPVFHRGVAILCALVSICILWSELVFNIKNPVISLVALGLKGCGFNYAAVELMAFFTLTFMCLCVYTSLFKVRFFNLYLLIPNHHTDENSLLWFTGYLCKMMAPLCYNYINLAGNSSGAEKSVFNQFMGHADLIPFLGTTFIDWFPVVILIPAVSAYFNVGGRCLSICGVKDPYENDEENPDSEGPVALSADIADGKALIDEERMIMERNINPDLSNQRGILNRARNALEAYTSKYNNRASSVHSTHSSRSLNTFANHRSPLSSNIRQERDRRIDEILSGRTTPNSIASTSSGNRYVHNNNSSGQDSTSSRETSSDEESGLQAFGETLKSKLNTLFTTKKGQQDAQPLLDPQPQTQHQHHPGNGGGGSSTRAGRVLGRPTSPEYARSRSPSPTPDTTRFSLAAVSSADRNSNTKPFTRYESNSNNNNMFNGI